MSYPRRIAAVLALSASLWAFGGYAGASTPAPVESAPRAFFAPDALIDPSLVEDLRHVSADLSDMYAQELGWTDSINLSQYGFATEEGAYSPARGLARALESQGWFIRWEASTGALLAFPPAA